VTLLGEVDVVAPDLFSTQLSGPRWSVAVVVAVLGLSLAWRCSFPGTVFTVVATLLAAQALLYGASEGNGVLVPALVATYSVARHGSRRAAYVALAAVAVVVLVRETNNPSNADWPATRAALAWDLTLALAWVAGSWLRARHLYETSLVDSAARDAVSEERARMARELHDSLAHSLTAVVVQAEAAEDSLYRDPDRARESIRNIGRAGRDALVELRGVVGALRESTPTHVEPAGGGLDDLVSSARASGLHVELAIGGSAGAPSGDVAEATYRVVQESLTNIVRHSRSDRACVEVTYGDVEVDVRVTDPGPADATRLLGSGHGLVGMRERVTRLGGRLETGTLADGGFAVHAVIPRTVR
jgi:signal transduction histidine kinase